MAPRIARVLLMLAAVALLAEQATAFRKSLRGGADDTPQAGGEGTLPNEALHGYAHTRALQATSSAPSYGGYPGSYAPPDAFPASYPPAPSPELVPASYPPSPPEVVPATYPPSPPPLPPSPEPPSPSPEPPSPSSPPPARPPKAPRRPPMSPPPPRPPPSPRPPSPPSPPPKPPSPLPPSPSPPPPSPPPPSPSPPPSPPFVARGQNLLNCQGQYWKILGTPVGPDPYYYFPFNNIKLKLQNTAACRAMCESNPACLSFYYRMNGQCYLLKDQGEFVYDIMSYSTGACYVYHG